MGVEGMPLSIMEGLMSSREPSAVAGPRTERPKQGSGKRNRSFFGEPYRDSGADADFAYDGQFSAVKLRQFPA